MKLFCNRAFDSISDHEVVEIQLWGLLETGDRKATLKLWGSFLTHLLNSIRTSPPGHTQKRNIKGFLIAGNSRLRSSVSRLKIITQITRLVKSLIV